jgi:hypothetical protein
MIDIFVDSKKLHKCQGLTKLLSVHGAIFSHKQPKADGAEAPSASNF